MVWHGHRHHRRKQAAEALQLSEQRQRTLIENLPGAAVFILAEAIRQTCARAHELVPLTLEEFGLAVALQDIGRKTTTPQLRLHCQVVLDEAAAPLPPALQMALYRMAQELAQNITKRARHHGQPGAGNHARLGAAASRRQRRRICRGRSPEPRPGFA